MLRDIRGRARGDRASLQKMRDLLTLAGPSDLVEMDYDDAVGAINVRVGEF